ncbi:hypothetical protein D9758_008149 [Tetrapyrgos nigripes]|uniref:Uncharacterized protein n=1 Tax=Tetrapyrgos nigripes TaxID=182062 RepID=A0A8H5LPL8_9AGAR|nr:hypothetical protein D9758_008149 [Tetrapyrgos nigripes]
MTSDSGTCIFDYLNDDVLGVICFLLNDMEKDSTSFLKSLSLSCKRFRTHCLAYIFQTFTLKHVGNNAWEYAMGRLKEWNSAVSQHSSCVREIFIKLIFGPSRIPSEFPKLLASTLSEISTSSQRLHKMTLHIDIDIGFAQPFQETFQQKNLHLIFPTVKRVIVSEELHYLVRHCPNAEYLSTASAADSTSDSEKWQWRSYVGASTSSGGPRDQVALTAFIEAAGELGSKLQCLMLGSLECNYEVEDLMNALYNAVPWIRMLDIQLKLFSNPYKSDHGSSRPEINLEKFEHLVSQLSRFPHLQKLSIADVDYLGFFDNNLPAFPFHDTRMDQLEVYCEAETIAASMVFRKCPGVVEVWFGGWTKATSTRMRHSHGDSEEAEAEPRYPIGERDGMKWYYQPMGPTRWI